MYVKVGGHQTDGGPRATMWSQQAAMWPMESWARFFLHT